MLHVGVDCEIADAFKLMLSVHETVSSSPIDYGPGVALMVRVPLGEFRGTSQYTW
jgi:hypothetical protein